MSKNYTHLSLVQRYQIEVLLLAGCQQKQVAAQLNVHPSTISRELKRNTGLRGKHAQQYLAFNAQRRADLRHTHKPKHVVFNEAEKQQVCSLMQVQKWSPELISAYFRRQGQPMVSHERIYQWIWHCKHSNRGERSALTKRFMGCSGMDADEGNEVTARTAGVLTMAG